MLRNAFVVVGLLSLLTGCGSLSAEEPTARLAEPLWGEESQQVQGAACQTSLSGSTALLGCVGGGVGGWAVAYDHSAAGWTALPTLPPSDFWSWNRFQLSGDTIIHGGMKNEWSPRARVLVRSGATWTDQQLPYVEQHLSNGVDVALSGDTALVGTVLSKAPDAGILANTGVVSIFVRAGGSWTEQQRLVPATPREGDRFGGRVALSGDTALVSSFEPTELGAETLRPVVHVFVRSGNQWTEQQKLAGTGDQELSTAFALSGDTAVVAGHSPAEAGNDNGIGFVFVRSGTTWSQQQVLTAPSAPPPIPYDQLHPPIVPPEAALFGERALLSSGDAVYLFERAAGIWTEKQEIFDPGYYRPAALSIGSDFAIASFWDEPDDFGIRGNTTFYELHDEDPGSCVVDGDCASGHCVDQICCDTECQGPCQSCRAAQKEFGADGLCGFISAGTDPSDGCSEALGEDGCGETGFCDGRGRCGIGPRGTPCGAEPYCSHDPQSAVHNGCNGLGKCATWLVSSCFRGYSCEDAACNISCTTDSNCDVARGYGCLDGACRLRLGVPCISDPMCQSGHCVDKVCCESACDEGQCSACSNALTGEADGICAPIPAGKDPQDECEPDADYPTSCGGDGLCDGAGSCRAHAEKGTVCGGTTCEAGEQAVPTCSGESAECLPQLTDCVAYACDGNVCGTRCADESDCNGDRGYCVSNHTCLESKADSARCLDDVECRSGVCTDGTCGDGAGGAPSANGGAPGDDGGTPGDDGGSSGSKGDDDTGCGCHLGRSQRSGSAWPLVALLAVGALGRRRRGAR
jgi:hypothetical protein